MNDTKQSPRAPTLGQDMGYERDFQLWKIARKASPEYADADNYRTIAACELQDLNAELVAALRDLEYAVSGDHPLHGLPFFQQARDRARAALAKAQS